jgi:histidine triad (HIT) family protein
VLVVPKKEVDLIFDLDSDSYQQLFDFAKAISKAIQLSIPCERVTIHVIGLEVPHAHIHLIPINTMNDCNFANQKLKLAKEEFEEIAKRISDNLSIS